MQKNCGLLNSRLDFVRQISTRRKWCAKNLPGPE